MILSTCKIHSSWIWLAAESARNGLQGVDCNPCSLYRVQCENTKLFRTARRLAVFVCRSTQRRHENWGQQVPTCRSDRPRFKVYYSWSWRLESAVQSQLTSVHLHPMQRILPRWRQRLRRPMSACKHLISVIPAAVGFSALEHCAYKVRSPAYIVVSFPPRSSPRDPRENPRDMDKREKVKCGVVSHVTFPHRQWMNRFPPAG